MPKDDPLNFNGVEALRKAMLLNMTHMAKALTVSRVTYSGWVDGKPIRKGNDAKIRVIIKRMFDIMKSGWPEPEHVAMTPVIRFNNLMMLLHPPMSVPPPEKAMVPIEEHSELEHTEVEHPKIEVEETIEAE